MVGADPIAAPLAHVALLLCALAPTVAVVDPNAQIVAVSTLSVVAGARRVAEQRRVVRAHARGGRGRALGGALGGRVRRRAGRVVELEP